MGRMRREEVDASQLEVGDTITPPSNYGRAKVTDLGKSDKITEPHVHVGYQYPDDFSVNASTRGQRSGKFYRPDDKVTRWVDGSSTKGKKGH